MSCSIRCIARDRKDEFPSPYSLILNITPTTVGACHVFLFETSCVTVLDTHHFRSPPKQVQFFCQCLLFNHQFPKSRPTCTTFVRSCKLSFCLADKLSHELNHLNSTHLNSRHLKSTDGTAPHFGGRGRGVQMFHNPKVVLACFGSRVMTCFPRHGCKRGETSKTREYCVPDG